MLELHDSQATLLHKYMAQALGTSIAVYGVMPNQQNAFERLLAVPLSLLMHLSPHISSTTCILLAKYLNCQATWAAL